MPKCEFNKVAKLQKTSSIVDRIINIPLACEIVFFYNSHIILLIFSLQKLMKIFIYCHNLPLCEKCPNTEFFPVRIFPHSDRIRRDTLYLSVFSPNTGKNGPEKTPYLDTFHEVFVTFINELQY